MTADTAVTAYLTLGVLLAWCAMRPEGRVTWQEAALVGAVLLLLRAVLVPLSRYSAAWPT